MHPENGSHWYVTPEATQAVRGPSVADVERTLERVASEFTLGPLSWVEASLAEGIEVVRPL